MTLLPNSMPGSGSMRTKVTIPVPIEQEIERAIDDIVKYNPLGIYKKVKETVEPEPAVTA